MTSKREKELARQRAARQAARRAERDRRRKQRNAVIASVVAVLLAAGAVGAAAVATRESDPQDVLSGDPTAAPSASAEPSDAASEAPGEEPGEEPAAEPVLVGDCRYRPDGEASRPVEPPSEQDLVTEGTRTATIATDQGDLTLELLAADAPCTVASFASLARQGFYADSPCHRLTTEGIFVLQCGDPTGSGRGGPGYQYDEENLEGATYPRGTVAMAKTQAPGTTGSQFFLVYQDTPLPPEYTPFARITEGLEVLDQVAEAGVDGGGADGAPAQPVQITSVDVA